MMKFQFCSSKFKKKTLNSEQNKFVQTDAYEILLICINWIKSSLFFNLWKLKNTVIYKLLIIIRTNDVDLIIL